MNPDTPRDRPWDDARAVPPMTPQQQADAMLREDQARRGLVHHSAWLAHQIRLRLYPWVELGSPPGIETIGDGIYRVQFILEGRLHNVDVYPCPVQMRADLDAMKAARDAAIEGEG